jgi:hypothetical protein
MSSKAMMGDCNAAEQNNFMLSWLKLERNEMVGSVFWQLS